MVTALTPIAAGRPKAARHPAGAAGEQFALELRRAAEAARTRPPEARGMASAAAVALPVPIGFLAVLPKGVPSATVAPAGLGAATKDAAAVRRPLGGPAGLGEGAKGAQPVSPHATTVRSLPPSSRAPAPASAAGTARIVRVPQGAQAAGKAPAPTKVAQAPTAAPALERTAPSAPRVPSAPVRATGVARGAPEGATDLASAVGGGLRSIDARAAAAGRSGSAAAPGPQGGAPAGVQGAHGPKFPAPARRPQPPALARAPESAAPAPAGGAAALAPMGGSAVRAQAGELRPAVGHRAAQATARTERRPAPLASAAAAPAAAQDLPAARAAAQPPTLDGRAEIAPQVAAVVQQNLPDVAAHGPAVLRMALSPPSLGHISISLSAAEGGVTAVLRAELPVAMQLMQAAQPEIRRRLQELGLGEASVRVAAFGELADRPPDRMGPQGRRR